MQDLSSEEMRIMERLNESPTMEGAETFELIGGDFNTIQQTLKSLEEKGLINIKGTYTDEKKIFYSTIFRQFAQK